MPFNALSKESADEILKRTSLALGYGYALYPRDWVVLNDADASSSKYAYVFEGRNGDKYGVPHFIYFSDICYYDVPARDSVCDKIEDLVRKYSRTCADAFNYQVQPVYMTSEDGLNEFVNSEEWDSSFVPGHFMLPIEGSPLPYCDKAIREYPFNARIVRPEGYSFKEESFIMDKLMNS